LTATKRRDKKDDIIFPPSSEARGHHPYSGDVLLAVSPLLQSHGRDLAE